MRKVVLRMNELFKFEVIKKLVDSNGNKKNAALKLNCTTRTINRLILKYKNEGKAGFIHKNRERIMKLPQFVGHLFKFVFLSS